MSKDESSFSDRHGYRLPDAEITIREDAPGPVRDAVVRLGYSFGLGPDSMRHVLCDLLLCRPDPNNWSPGNIENEVLQLADDAPWFKIYDLAERLHDEIAQGDFTGERQVEFSDRLNASFRQLGVGWVMEHGRLVVRGSEAFEVATADAVAVMDRSGAPTAAIEIHEALKDISRRPEADVTGAIQHAMASLECVAREVHDTKETLGKIIGQMIVPPPLDTALHRLWGFASEQGRHIQEGRRPRFEEAELVVTVACAVGVYLLRDRAARGGGEEC